MNKTGYFWRETDARAAAAGRLGVGVLRAVGRWMERAAADLDPGYFALVMATGIVSNAFFLQNYRPLSDALFAVNLVAYPWLWLLTLWRAAQCRRALWADLLDPSRVFLFFTTVAATDVFGMSIGLRGFAGVALVLWLVALALWLALTYFGFAVLLFHNHEKRADVIGGAWLNAIVGTQSLVIVGGALAMPAAHLGPQAFILLPMLWAIGLVLYGILIVLICQRFFFSAVAPDEVAPPLWVVMGAAAISVNAGLILLTNGSATPFVRLLQPFLGGTTLAVWAWATWWIPLLLLLGLWKHGVHRRPLGYSPLLWSMVFPLGMYAAATLRLSRFAAVPALATWSSVMAWIALAAWCATAIGLCVSLWRSLWPGAATTALRGR
jgi:tellurite resistance protein TehA-like permease